MGLRIRSGTGTNERSCFLNRLLAQASVESPRQTAPKSGGRNPSSVLFVGDKDQHNGIVPDVLELERRSSRGGHLLNGMIRGNFFQVARATHFPFTAATRCQAGLRVHWYDFEDAGGLRRRWWTTVESTV